MDAEKIIIKKPRNSKWNEYELFYPEKTANYGRIVCQSFLICGNIINTHYEWDSHSEATLEYYKECKAVDKDLAIRIAQVTSEFYRTPFKVARRINWKNHKAWK